MERAAVTNPIRIAAIAAVLLTGWWFFGGDDDAPDSVLLYTVQEQPFSSRVVEAGVLNSLHQVLIASPLPSNRGKIIAMAEEGNYVHMGDLLVEFDAAPFIEDQQRYQAEIREMDGVLKQAREEFRMQELDGERSLASISHEIEMIELESRNSNEGEMQVRVREAEARLADTHNEWQRSQTEYKDLQALLKDGFVTRSEVDQARIKAEQAKNEYELQRQKIRILREIAIPAEQEKTDSEISKKKKDLQRQQEMTMASLGRSRAAIAGAEAKLTTAQANLAATEALITQTRIMAEAPGFVIMQPVPVGGERRKVHVGDTVWEHQSFMLIPDISRMAVEIRVREVDVHKLQQDQKASIRLDSYPDLVLKGRISSIGAIAESAVDYRGGKFFRVNVLVDGEDKRLRPGMTARADIIVGEFEHVLQIPLNALYKRDDLSYCQVWDDGEMQERELKTGVANDNFVIVREGLEAGEQVVLAAPESTDQGR